eukprot:TRINITY_DN72486_c0_g1_i1.p1 TRINITY_DN72486_c0_g1~~TRINITY_DN72486_c0_g1_i1.p1  ORF type:complete len:322 (+),score=17.56 TRINITY_DN72486_c0_g1_i1:74-1039(+)
MVGSASLLASRLETVLSFFQPSLELVSLAACSSEWLRTIVEHIRCVEVHALGHSGFISAHELDKQVLPAALAFMLACTKAVFFENFGTSKSLATWQPAKPAEHAWKLSRAISSSLAVVDEECATESSHHLGVRSNDMDAAACNSGLPMSYFCAGDRGVDGCLARWVKYFPSGPRRPQFLSVCLCCERTPSQSTIPSARCSLFGFLTLGVPKIEQRYGSGIVLFICLMLEAASGSQIVACVSDGTSTVKELGVCESSRWYAITVEFDWERKQAVVRFGRSVRDMGSGTNIRFSDQHCSGCESVALSKSLDGCAVAWTDIMLA